MLDHPVEQRRPVSALPDLSKDGFDAGALRLHAPKVNGALANASTYFGLTHFSLTLTATAPPQERQATATAPPRDRHSTAKQNGAGKEAYTNALEVQGRRFPNWRFGAAGRKAIRSTNFVTAFASTAARLSVKGEQPWPPKNRGL